MMTRIALVLTWLILCAVPAGAGTIAPGLEAVLKDLGEDDPVKVLVVLEQQADIKALDGDLRAAKSTRPERHRLVVNSLRDTASRTQFSLLAELTTKAASGQVLSHVPHWLINAVVVTATPATVREIAARPDVARIEPDLVVSLIETVPGSRSLPEIVAQGGAGLTPNIQAVGAPRVWNELGIDGTGTIVGVMDTGVDGTHPALAARWRGNFAPAQECWLDAAGLGDPSFPVDRFASGHGTHVAGLVTGLAPGDTIGVAPGARWIAANTIAGGLGPLDNAVLASLEFMADPDGDPATSDDVPDVVQNSWGVSEAMLGYIDCDSRWWDAIDNCEAAGVVLVWAAGNEGPYSSSLRSPADRASSPYNCFAVGSAATAPPFLVSEFSSRGPSGCEGVYAIKPELVAPGEDIYSAGPGGGYRLHSGSSMAGPHVAGVVALMRQANPDVDVATIKEVLLDTALDLGDPGPDNHYGHGFLDAYAAVTAVMNEVGTLSGNVIDLATGLPVSGARVARIDGFNFTLTDANGDFSLTMLAGPASFSVSKFGYFDGAFSVTILPGGVTHQGLPLVPEPTAVISGQVFGPDGQPVPLATVAVVNQPAPAVMSDPAGFFALTLPRGAGRIYDLAASAQDLGYDFRSVELVGDLTLDFQLPEQFVEDFETGGFFSFPWTGGGAAPWTIDPDTRFEGNFSARAGSILNDQSSSLSLQYYVSVDSYLQFWTRVSSEYYYDNLVFYLDGQELAAWSGERDWSQYRRLIPRGHHTFAWVYERDVAYAEGQNTAWLDFVEFPTTGEELFPEISLDVASVSAAVAEGDTVSVGFTISNLGDWTLDFSISVGDLLKDGGLSRPGKNSPASRKATSGGPDAFGYQWQNSDHPGGPVYGWVDISTTGTIAGSGDDAVHGPFPLGFAFPYYGAIHQTVNLSTNGFLSFDSAGPAPENIGIPEVRTPNNLVAPFWDDLDPGSAGAIFYRSEPTVGRFIVQYDQVVRADTGLPETFQVILEADGRILFQYAEVQDSGQCTVGIENAAGDDGLLVAFNQAGFLRDGLAVLLDPPVIMATVVPGQGQVAPGASVPAVVKFDASGLAPGSHVAVMTISSNDPDRPELLVPLLLNVASLSAVPGDEVPRTAVFFGAIPNPFNPATNLKFGLPASAQVTLDLFDVSGRRVRALMSEELPAGHHAVRWNGRDDAGRDVASGAYFARLTVDGVSSVKSVTLVR